MAEKASQPKAAPKQSENPAEQALEKLSNQLSCSLCLNEFRKPRVLPCLHVFCEDCLEEQVKTQQDKLRAICSNCRKSTPLPEGGVSGLPSAFYIQHLFEVREVLEKVRNPEQAQCEKCGEGEVQGFCRDCGLFICQNCLDTHSKWKELQVHEICSLDNIEKRASKMVTPKKVVSMCPKHTTEPIKIYCETCDQVICRDCTVKTHRNHNYDLIPDAFPKHRDALLASLEPIKSELVNVGKIIAVLKERSSRLDGQGMKAKAKVDAEVTKLHAILEARRKELHSEIDGKVGQGKKELGAEIDRHELRQAQLSSCVEFVEASLQSGTQEEVLSIKAQIKQRARQMAADSKPEQLKPGPPKIVRVVYMDLSRTYQKMGGIKFGSIGIHVKTIDGIIGPRHIAFASTGELVVCEWKGNCMKVFDSHHRQVLSFGNAGSKESMLNVPFGVAISPDDTVFVAAKHCVKKFTLNGQFIALVGSEGKEQQQFCFPWAIAYNCTNNKVYVCDTANHRITILNHDLTFHGSFGRKGNKTAQFKEPKGISVDASGNVLVADRANNTVQVFDANGAHLKSITHTTAEHKLQGPISVAVGPDHWVYVVEFDSDRVSVFDESYKYVKSFGKRGEEDGEFHDPYAIAVSRDGYIYVSDTENNRVQVFK